MKKKLERIFLTKAVKYISLLLAIAFGIWTWILRSEPVSMLLIVISGTFFSIWSIIETEMLYRKKIAEAKPYFKEKERRENERKKHLAEARRAEQMRERILETSIFFGVFFSLLSFLLLLKELLEKEDQ